MVNVPNIKLNDGHEIPVIGLGTYKVRNGAANLIQRIDDSNKFLQPLGEVSENAVKDAIDCGYRHIDTAYVYKNEVEVGNAVRQKIAENIVTRSDMYIVTKVLHNRL